MTNLKQHPIIQQYIEWNAFGRLIGMDYEITEPGKVVYALQILPKHLATPVAAHGGAVAALMDAALGVACLSKVCTAGKIVSTVTINVQFLNPALLHHILRCVATVSKNGNRLLFVEATVYNQDNEIVAKASATMNAYPVEKVLNS